MKLLFRLGKWVFKSGKPVSSDCPACCGNTSGDDAYYATIPCPGQGSKCTPNVYVKVSVYVAAVLSGLACPMVSYGGCCYTILTDATYTLAQVQAVQGVITGDIKDEHCKPCELPCVLICPDTKKCCCAGNGEPFGLTIRWSYSYHSDQYSGGGVVTTEDYQGSGVFGLTFDGSVTTQTGNPTVHHRETQTDGNGNTVVFQDRDDPYTPYWYRPICNDQSQSPAPCNACASDFNFQACNQGNPLEGAGFHCQPYFVESSGTLGVPDLYETGGCSGSVDCYRSVGRCAWSYDSRTLGGPENGTNVAYSVTFDVTYQNPLDCFGGCDPGCGHGIPLVFL